MPNRVLEKNRRMSESLLWDLQNKAYSQRGETAWTEGLVPSYITSNPFIAKRYAELAIAYIRDNIIDPAEPVYIFDLGAGSGRFAFLFLKAFKRLLPEELKFKYILTDIAEPTLAFWQTQSAFQSDQVDFAFFHHAQEGNLQLVKSGEVIEKSRNPVILIANYFFDTVPQDLFRIRNGELEEGRITLSGTGDEEWELSDPRFIPSLECRYDYVPFEAERYSQEVVNILRGYQKLENAAFLFPSGGVAALQFFERISSNLLLLAGDQGVCTEAQILTSGEPELTKHTTFSIAVNYHALAAYFRQKGGVAFLTSFPDPVFANIAAALGTQELPELRRVFENQFDAFEPKDYFLLVSEAEKQSYLSLDYLLLLMKLGDFDPVNLNHFFHQILPQMGKATTQQKADWERVFDAVFDRLYITNPEEGNFVMNLGVLFYEMGNYGKALQLFQRSVQIMGEKPQVRANIAASLLKLHYL